MSELYKDFSLSEAKDSLEKIFSDKKSQRLPLAVSNIKIIQNLFEHKSESRKKDFIFAQYQKNDIVVNSGSISSYHLSNQIDFNYAYVPLGIIVEGEIIVNKGGKATKRLLPGDFIGLFETGDWILTKQKREIGDWTLTANT